MDVQAAFQAALHQHSAGAIARKFGLHENTIMRWVETGAVPANYRGDFLRLIGVGDDGAGDQRAKGQFYTKPHIARRCHARFARVAAKLGVDLARYRFIEPSAGCGWF